MAPRELAITMSDPLAGRRQHTAYLAERWARRNAPPAPTPTEVVPTERLHELLRRLSLAASRAAGCPSAANLNAVTETMRRVNARFVLDTASQRQAGPSLGRTGTW